MTTARGKASPGSAVDIPWYELIDDPEPPEDEDEYDVLADEEEEDAE